MSLEATIKISLEARDALKAIGRKGESYDTILRRLIKSAYAAGAIVGAPALHDLFDIEEEAEGR